MTCECNICRAKRDGVDPTIYGFAEKDHQFIKDNPGQSTLWYVEKLWQIEQDKYWFWVI